MSDHKKPMRPHGRPAMLFVAAVKKRLDDLNAYKRAGAAPALLDLGQTDKPGEWSLHVAGLIGLYLNCDYAQVEGIAGVIERHRWQQPVEGEPSDEAIIDAMKAEGGSVHGPHVETVSIPLTGFLRCTRAVLALKPVVREPLSEEYIEQHIGPDEDDREAVTAIVREVEQAHGIAAAPQHRAAVEPTCAFSDDCPEGCRGVCQTTPAPDSEGGETD